MAGAAAFACGAGSVFLGAVLVGASLMFTEGSFLEVAGLVVTAHLPIMVIEGVVTVFCVAFLKKVKPEMLPGSFNSSAVDETAQPAATGKGQEP